MVRAYLFFVEELFDDGLELVDAEGLFEDSQLLGEVNLTLSLYQVITFVNSYSSQHFILVFILFYLKHVL